MIPRRPHGSNGPSTGQNASPNNSRPVKSTASNQTTGASDSPLKRHASAMGSPVKGNTKTRANFAKSDEISLPQTTSNSTTTSESKGGSRRRSVLTLKKIPSAEEEQEEEDNDNDNDDEEEEEEEEDNGNRHGSNTFLTALALAKTTKDLNHFSMSYEGENFLLRPPSPLEAADEDAKQITVGLGTAEGELPQVTNYIGPEALSKFWRMFQRQEISSNYTSITSPTPCSSSSSFPSSSTPTVNNSTTTTTKTKKGQIVAAATSQPRPTSARTSYFAALRKLHLSPEPMGIIRRHAQEKIATSTSSSGGPCSIIPSNVSSAQEINLSSYCMGNLYGQAFAESFALMPNIESMNLSNNRINDLTASSIVHQAYTTHGMVLSLQHLNLSYNTLGIKTAKELCVLLTQSKNLLTLNLSHCQLKDPEILLLSETLQKLHQMSLTRLYLNENHFSCQGVLGLAKFLEQNTKIEELYLSWNKIRGLGAVKLMEAVKFHPSLRALDLSWNSLDSNDPLLSTLSNTIVSTLADAIANNKILSHLDLSNNRLNENDCQILAKALESNQSLVGLHMAGNVGVMDSRGFLQLKQKETSLQDQHRLISSMAIFEEYHSENGGGINNSNHTNSHTNAGGAFPDHLSQLVDRTCWYCGQYTEYRFLFHPSIAQEIISTAGGQTTTGEMDSLNEEYVVYLHLSCDDWMGREMEKREEDGMFFAYRILPPGKTEYFFTILEKKLTNTKHSNKTQNTTGNNKCSFFVLKEKKTIQKSINLSSIMSYILSPSLLTQNVGQSKHIPVNYVRIPRREGKEPCHVLTPRSNVLTNANVKNGKHNSTRFDINKSVFAGRRRESVCRSFVDTDAYVLKAFGADFKQCKFDRFIKDPIRRREVESALSKHYRTICGIYRKYCGHNVLTSTFSNCLTVALANQIQTDVSSVPFCGFLEFVQETKILDENSEFCKLADLTNVFLAANLELTQEAKEKDNPDRNLTRFEFVEAVTRIAINKYHKTNICETPGHSIEKLMQEHLLAIAPEDPNEFRLKYLYTGEVSEIFADHIVMLQEIYNANMGKYCKPGERKGMQLVELIEILHRYQVFNDFFRVRDVKDPFLDCKLFVLDEMATVGYKKLFVTDFMEVLLRLSVLRYPPVNKTSIEAAKSLQKLLSNHLIKHENLLEQFVETVDRVSIQHRVEQLGHEWQRKGLSKYHQNNNRLLEEEGIEEQNDDRHENDNDDGTTENDGNSDQQLSQLEVEVLLEAEKQEQIENDGQVLQEEEKERHEEEIKEVQVVEEGVGENI